MIRQTLKLWILATLLTLGLLSTVAVASTFAIDAAAEQAQVIYDLYAEEDFAAIYERMAPEIQSLMTSDEYVEYQQRHFARLRLRISEIEVGGVRQRTSLPSSFQDVIDIAAYDHVVSVSVSYRASFLVMRMRHEESLDKHVYFGVRIADGNNPDQWFLLWDPAVLEEDAPDAE